MRRALMIVGCAVALLALSAPAKANQLPGGFWGLDAFDQPTAQDAELMRQTGVAVVRTQFLWTTIEPERPRALDALFGIRRYDWQGTDAWVRSLAGAGITAHALLIGSPGWLTPQHDHTPVDSAEGREGWRDFVRGVVERYGRRGSFWAENPGLPRLPIDTYQIWNEQNSSVRYKPAPNVAEYGALLRIAAREIRAADPEARVVLGGMFGTPTAPNSIRAWTFLRRLYEIGGMRSNFDAVAVHPYSPNLRGIRYQMRQMRRVMREGGDPAKPVQITELGWSSATGGDHFFFQGPRGQAQMLRQSFRLLLQRRERWNVERIVWHAWRDTRSGPGCSHCEHFGLRRLDLSPKRAYRAYRRFATGRTGPG